MAAKPDLVPPAGTPSPLAEGYLTVKQTAERMGLPVEAVRALCKDGSLSGAERRQGCWYIPLSAIEAWRQARFVEPAGSDAGTARTPKARSADSYRESGPPAWWQRFRFSPWIFYPVTVISVLIVLAGVLFGLISAGADLGGFSRQVMELGLMREFPSEREGETLIVVAQFYHAEGIVDTHAHTEIRSALQAAVRELGASNIRVTQSLMSIATDDPAQATRLGKRYNASMVIWGSDTGVRITVNFLNLRFPNTMAAQARISETQRTQLADPSAYASFVTHDLPGQVSFFSLFAIGQSYFVQGAHENAIKAIEKGIGALVPTSEAPKALAEAYLWLGWIHQEDRRQEEAMSSYTKAIDLSPEFALAYNNRGTVLFRQQDLSGSIRDLDKAIEFDPKLAIAYNNRCAARYDRNDLEGALQDCNRAIELDPKSDNAYYSRCIIHGRQGDLANAIRDCTQTITLNPNYAAAYHNRGAVRTALDDTAAAIDDFTKAIELNYRSSDVYSGRGVAYYKQGSFLAATKDFDKAIEMEPQNAVLYVNRAHARDRLGDVTGAIADYRRYLLLRPAAPDGEEVRRRMAEIMTRIANP